MTDDIHEIPSTTPDLRSELAQQLQKLVPEAIADGKVDMVKLKELLGEDAASESERFGLFWPGKRQAQRAAQEPTKATLNPDVANSKDWDSTKNVLIEGDNLEVLKILQKHYHGKIKMIYIDPPYNTGSDFVYSDNYQEGLASYLEYTKQVDEGGKKLSTNSESDGRYHSNWLNMMYPRLKLARNLLADDGVMFVSIGEREITNLTRLASEIFGEDNVETIIWNKISETGSAGQGKMKVTYRFRKDHEYLLVLYRRKSLTYFNKPLRVKSFKNEYGNADNDERGPWVSSELCKSEEKSLPTGKNFYTITTPGGMDVSRQWHVSPEEFKKLDSEKRIYWGKGTTIPRLKKFVNEPQPQTPTSILSGFSQTEGNKDLSNIMGGVDIFDNPKPVGLIRWLAEIATDKTSIVMDFFSGSGTTAHAVMELNAQDGGSRRHIQIQLPEPTELGSRARVGGFGTISEIMLKRLDLAGDSLYKKFPNGLPGGKNKLDIGYRYFKLTDTNFSKWKMSSDTDAETLTQHLLSLRDSADDDSTQDVLLTELLLKGGYSLTERIEAAEIAGLELRSVGCGLVLAYLNEHHKPTLAQLREVVATQPERFIILEDSFHGDDELKTNLVQICKTANVELWTA